MNLINTIEKLCSIHAPSGHESKLIGFLSDWFKKQSTGAFIDDYSINNTLLVSKGIPKVAFVVHADSVGFILQYNNKLLPLGSPEVNQHTVIITANGEKASIEFKDKKNIFLNSEKHFERGTTFTFLPDFKIVEDTIQSPSLDDRMGIALLMKLFNEVDDVFIVITSNEETCGGSLEKASKIMYEQFKLQKAIIVDTTFDTEGIHVGEGVVLSLKDQFLPPERLIKEVKTILSKSNIPYQLEIEDYGSSDGGYLHHSPYPIDWCFIGIACKNNHSNREIINIQDLNYLYQALFSINQMCEDFGKITKTPETIEKLNNSIEITTKTRTTKKSTTKKEAKKVTATAGDDKKMNEALDNIAKISSELKKGNEAMVAFLKKYEQFEKQYSK